MASESRSAVSSTSSSSSPTGKRTRDPEDEIYLDNLRSQKRYLSEVSFSFSLFRFQLFADLYTRNRHLQRNLLILSFDFNSFKQLWFTVFWCLNVFEISPIVFFFFFVDNGLQFKRTNSRRLNSGQHVRVSSSVWELSLSQVIYVTFFSLLSLNLWWVMYTDLLHVLKCLPDSKKFWEWVWLLVATQMPKTRKPDFEISHVRLLRLRLVELSRVLFIFENQMIQARQALVGLFSSLEHLEFTKF